MNAAAASQSPLVIADQGHFWVGVRRRALPAGTVAADPMFVQFQIPAQRLHPHPLVMVHGGGGQGLDFLATLDGRPGWAGFFLRQGFAVYVVDRPGHGRARGAVSSLSTPAADTVPPTYETLAEVLFGADASSPRHTQWPGPRSPYSDLTDQFCASQGSVAADTPDGERITQEAAAALLDRIGPSILLTHSLGAAFGWLAAQARPAQVKAIVAVEPAAPPRASPPGSSQQLAVLVVSGEASGAADIDAATVDALRQAGAAAQHLRLETVGIHGNGHLMMLEKNSDQIAGCLLDWLTHVSSPADGPSP